MTATAARSKRTRPDFSNLIRAVRGLGHYRGITIGAYVALFLATGAQLLVPQMVQNILDAVTSGLMAQQIAALPVAAQPAMLQRVGMSLQEYQARLDNLEGPSTGPWRSSWSSP